MRPGSKPPNRPQFHGTCAKLTRSLHMDEQHQQARRLYADRRHRDRQMLRDSVSRRLQTYFITLRETFPSDANVLLQRVELQTTPYEHRGR